ncbi:DUF2271 domain-containing protein [Flavobacterium sp. PLA-1-15]|uniref:DUF2271 domain-containing protein n=1 Tax=Flavobacterium sp. PLA-1-15 TaxID=3380533 RepID=UPI003B7D6B81
MKNLVKIAFTIALVCSSFVSFAQKTATTKYKCMVQMTNYPGEGAYIVVSLIDPKGAYEKTLYMMGPDKQWYKDLKEWNKFQNKKKSNINAITGASIAGGDRSMTVLEIENSKINAGYSLRFESAVENQEYHLKDLEFPLTTENLAKKNEGTGYIRYVRLNAN